MKYIIVLAAAVLSAGWTGQAARAQGPDNAKRDPAAAEDRDQWEYGQSYVQRPEPRDIIQQKAIARSHQRMARMAAMRWYGMYNERPTASPMPFTTVYSPVWQMPGGRPYAWYHRGWASYSIVVQH